MRRVGGRATDPVRGLAPCPCAYRPASGTLSIGVIRGWRSTFWVILGVFMAGLLRVLYSALQLTGIVPRQGPVWYVVLPGPIGLIQFCIAVVMLAGYGEVGGWGRGSSSPETATRQGRAPGRASRPAPFKKSGRSPVDSNRCRASCRLRGYVVAKSTPRFLMDVYKRMFELCIVLSSSIRQEP